MAQLSTVLLVASGAVMFATLVIADVAAKAECIKDSHAVSLVRRNIFLPNLIINNRLSITCMT